MSSDEHSKLSHEATPTAFREVPEEPSSDQLLKQSASKRWKQQQRRQKPQQRRSAKKTVCLPLFSFFSTSCDLFLGTNSARVCCSDCIEEAPHEEQSRDTRKPSIGRRDAQYTAKKESFKPGIQVCVLPVANGEEFRASAKDDSFFLFRSMVGYNSEQEDHSGPRAAFLGAICAIPRMLGIRKSSRVEQGPPVKCRLRSDSSASRASVDSTALLQDKLLQFRFGENDLSYASYSPTDLQRDEKLYQNALGVDEASPSFYSKRTRSLFRSLRKHAHKKSAASGG